MTGGPSAWASGAGGLVAAVALVYTVARVVRGPEDGWDGRVAAKRVVFAGVGAQALGLVGLALSVGVAMTRELPGDGFDGLWRKFLPSAPAAVAVAAMEPAWKGTGWLLLCLVAAGALLLLQEGKGRWAAGLLVGAGVLLAATAAVGGEAEFHRRWDPDPNGGPHRIVVSGGPSAPWLAVRPILDLLLVPAGIAVLLGMVSLRGGTAGRRPWPRPPGDSLLVLGTAAGVLVATMHMESAFLERARAMLQFHTPFDFLLEDLLFTVPPAAAVAWTGLAALSAGMVRRRREALAEASRGMVRG